LNHFSKVSILFKFFIRTFDPYLCVSKW